MCNKDWRYKRKATKEVLGKPMKDIKPTFSCPIVWSEIIQNPQSLGYIIFPSHSF